jgi:hypothetical protein
VVEEAHELVDDGLITEEDFRDYTFANAATLYAGMNPDFFKGTVCVRGRRGETAAQCFAACRADGFGMTLQQISRLKTLRLTLELNRRDVFNLLVWFSGILASAS